MARNYSYIIADHIRAASFIIADGVEPSGKQRGYVLRRLIRRALSASLKLNIDITERRYFEDLVEAVIGIYEGVYDEIKQNRQKIVDILVAESAKYSKAIAVGQREWAKVLKNQDQLNLQTAPDFLADKAWDLYQTHGVPLEVSEDILENHHLTLDKIQLENLLEQHQKLSHSTSAGQFKGGLSQHNEKTIRLHTATHLLHKVLRDRFGEQLYQKGSAITSEKARFDFALDRKLEEEEILQIEAAVQELIDLNLDVERQEMSQTEARQLGAIGLFGEKYGDVVSVYSIKDNQGTVYSREFCGGPHVHRTKEIGQFRILRQKSVGQGVRRLEFDVG